ncbi:hypothetical protein Tco_1079866 [Tanacetum coccineum]|uniref:Tf2-1-like SH3-like domain-containing protein n=1 Tax=Tanacetum coccineum TaxID=301880 RepID=A0ABQ5HT22_9ASTR
MKQQADKNKSERTFAVGDWVLLKLQPYKQVSIRKGKQNKFSPKYYGPFEVIEKKCRGEVPAQAQPVVLPHCDDEGLLIVPSLAVLDRKIIKRNNVVAVYGLIQWSNGSLDDATWELLKDLLKRFPTFDISS